GGLVIHGEHGVDLGVGSQHVREVVQAGLAGELGGVGDHVHVGSDLGDLLLEALLAQLGNGAGRGHVQHDHSAGLANLVHDVLGAGGAHALVVAGHVVHALGVDDDVKVHNG